MAEILHDDTPKPAEQSQPTPATPEPVKKVNYTPLIITIILLAAVVCVLMIINYQKSKANG